MAFLFMCIFIFICVIFCLSLILNRKCLLAKIQENIIYFDTFGGGGFDHSEVIIKIIKGDGRQGTTDESATIPFHLVLFSAAQVGQLSPLLSTL